MTTEPTQAPPSAASIDLEGLRIFTAAYIDSLFAGGFTNMLVNVKRVIAEQKLPSRITIGALIACMDDDAVAALSVNLTALAEYFKVLDGVLTTDLQRRVAAPRIIAPEQGIVIPGGA